jgi:DNA-binding protein HU-beta
MTKADIVADIALETGLEKTEALRAVEAFMNSIKSSLSKGTNVYLRGFGSFIVKERAEKTGRNISKKNNNYYSSSQYPFF